MTDRVRPPERAPSPTGSVLALLAVGVAGVLVGMLLDPVGAGVPALGAIAAAGLLWVTLRRLGETGPDLILGMVGLGVTAALLPGLFGLSVLWGTEPVGVGVVALTLVGTAFAAIAGSGRTAPAVRDTAVPLVLMSVVAGPVLLLAAAVTAVGPSLDGGIGRPLTPFGALVLLQVAGLLAVVALPYANVVLGRLLGPDRYTPPLTLDTVGPRWYWAAVILQLLAIPVVRLPFDGTLYAVPTVGPVFRLLLDGGLLVGAAVLVLALLWSVVAFGRFHRFLTETVDEPTRSVAVVTPALVAVAVVAALSVLLTVGALGRVIPGTPETTGVSLLQLGWPLFGGPFLLLGVIVATHVGTATARPSVLVPGAFGFMLALLTTLCVAVAAGTAGVAPPVVFAVVGLGLLAWESGEHAADLGQQLGREADTAPVEFTRVLALTAVIGVVAATLLLVVYFGPPIAVSSEQALFALVSLGTGILALTIYSVRSVA